MIIMTDTLYLNDEYLKAKKFSDLLVIINLLKGREEPCLRLQGLVLCTAVHGHQARSWMITGVCHLSHNFVTQELASVGKYSFVGYDSASCYNKTC